MFVLVSFFLYRFYLSVILLLLYFFHSFFILFILFIFRFFFGGVVFCCFLCIILLYLRSSGLFCFLIKRSFCLFFLPPLSLFLHSCSFSLSFYLFYFYSSKLIYTSSLPSSIPALHRHSIFVSICLIEFYCMLQIYQPMYQQQQQQ